MPVVPGSLLNGYRVFLSKLSSRSYFDDASRRPSYSSKLLQRLRARALQTRGGVDPFRAFRRLKAAALEIKGRQKTTLALRNVFRKATPNAKHPELQELFGQEGLLRTALILGLGHLSKLVMQFGNETVIYGEEHLHRALQRERGTPLITVSNHVGSIDDPLVTATLVPTSAMLQAPNVRWTICATDRCFTSAFLTNFSRSVKILPVERGAGLNQVGMRAAEHRLNEGDWIHIFPEGTRSRTGELLPPRLGVGKLVANCDRMPLVIPFIHSGMKDVLPAGTRVPRTGKKVRVIVGEPISFADVIEKAEEKGWTDADLYKAISHKIGHPGPQKRASRSVLGLSMAQLWSELEEKPLPAWARRKTTISMRPRLSRDLFREIPSYSFVRFMARGMQKAELQLGRYLEYCQMRHAIVRDTIFAPSPST